MPFRFGLFFVCVWLQIFVCTHILFIQEKLPKKTPFSFLFGKVILVLVFGFYFVREQILSQAMNAHTCFRRKQMRHFFIRWVNTTYTHAHANTMYLRISLAHLSPNTVGVRR